MSNITNLNRDYLIKINVKEATIDVPKMTFWNTDKKTSNMFVQLVINMSTNELISNYVTVQNATDYKITLNVIKPKTNQYKTIEATLLNEEKALFEIDLPDEYKDQVGNYNFEFEVSSKVDGNDESITTSNATYEVKGSILTNLNEETSSSPDLPILKQLIEQVKSLQGGDLTGYQKKSDTSLETTSKEIVGAINEVNSQYKDIANLSLTKHTDGKVYIKKQDGTLLGNGIEIGGSDVDLSKISMSMDNQTLKLLNNGTQIATVEIPTAVVTDEQLTSIIQSKIDDGTLTSMTIADDSITWDKIQKTYPGKTSGEIVDYWYYNDNKTRRTDGTSVRYKVLANKEYRIPNVINGVFGKPYLLDLDESTIYINENYMYWNVEGVMHFKPSIDGYLMLCHTYAPNTYYKNVNICTSDGGLDTETFLGQNMNLNYLSNIEIIDNPHKIYPGKYFNVEGVLMSGSNFPWYELEDGFWYFCTIRPILIDEAKNFIKISSNKYIYADGNIKYLQASSGTEADFIVTKLKAGIIKTNNLPYIDINQINTEYNKPIYNGIVCFGDSIMAGGYPDSIAQYGYCAVTNYGSSGADTNRICKFITGYGASGYNQQTIHDGHNTILIQAGINDGSFKTIAESVPQSVTGNIKDILEGRTITVGENTVSSLADYYALFDLGMCGQLAFIVEWLQAKYPTKRILLCNYHNNTSRQTKVVTQENVVKEISEYYGVEIIDIRRGCGINPRNEDDYLQDKLHPNQNGNIVIAKAILRAM